MKELLQYFRVFAISGAIGFLLISYNNCAPFDAAQQESTLFNSNNGCGSAEELFAKTYHKFLKSNCVACHVTGGPGKGAFADAQVGVAWRAFSLVGFAKVAEFAVNPGHNAPFTGEKHEGEIAKLSQNWINGQQDIQRCQSQLNGGSADDDFDFGASVGPRIHTISKSLSGIKVGNETTIRWNLGDEIASVDAGLTADGYVLPDLKGARFEITVRQLDVPGQVAYSLTRPRLINNTGTDLRVSSILAKINNDSMAGQTTFKFTEVDVRKGTGDGADEYLSFGSLVIVGELSANDKISINFGRIEVVELDPPDPGPIVDFVLASQRAPNLSDDVEVRVKLSQSPDIGKPVFVGLAIDHGAGVKTRNGEKFDNYDWDYVVDTLNLSFEPGQTEKVVRVSLNNHQRHGNDKQITFRLASLTNSTAGSVDKHVLTLPNDNPAPAPGEITLSMLMTGNGVLLQRCLECHNNGDRQGGYDMSDYKLMVQNGVIVPGNPGASSMIHRIRGTVTPQMPFDQPLTPTERILIEQWIQAGAKNN